MHKIFILMITCLNMVFLHADHLVVGTNAEFPPFCFIEKGEIVGFDIDVAKEVAKRLGKEIQWKDMPFDALIPAIVMGNLDFAAAGMSYTEERAKRVLFTKSYLAEDPLVIFSKKETHGIDDLKNKAVIVVEGFTADLFMSSKDVNLTRLPTQADGFMAIKQGRADAFVTAKSTVDAFLEKQPESNYHIVKIEETGETCALVIPKNKPEMLVLIQKELDAMEKDGTMAKLKSQWKLGL